MKQCIKIGISFVCALVMLFSIALNFSTTAFAVENHENEYSFSEYDFITSVRTMSADELADMKLSAQEIELIRSDAIEQELLSRKDKTDEELVSRYRYTEEQISVLRSYNGERLEDSAEIAAITGTLTIGKPKILEATSTRVGLEVIWSWDHAPIVCWKDVIAVYWDPTFGSNDGNMRINIADSSHVVRYYISSNATDTLNWDVTQVSANSAAKSTFAMQDADQVGWADKGTLTLYFDAAEGSAALTEMDFIFAYGHTILTISPSVYYPASGGISFGTATDEADRRSGYVNVARDTWTDN